MRTREGRSSMTLPMIGRRSPTESASNSPSIRRTLVPFSMPMVKSIRFQMRKKVRGPAWEQIGKVY
jgi:hypothetical protein